MRETALMSGCLSVAMTSLFVCRRRSGGGGMRQKIKGRLRSVRARLSGRSIPLHMISAALCGIINIPSRWVETWSKGWSKILYAVPIIGVGRITSSALIYNSGGRRGRDYVKKGYNVYITHEFFLIKDVTAWRITQFLDYITRRMLYLFTGH